MKICAVICEYNPFHFGHAYQISEMKKRGAVIAVMSGNFTQRGDAAVLSKYERAEIAVRYGADLVLELPFPYSSASAEIFGGAGVRIAHALGCVDELCFGSETGEIAPLLTLSDRLQSEGFRKALSVYLEKNRSQSYRSAVGKAYREFYGEDFRRAGRTTFCRFPISLPCASCAPISFPLRLCEKERIITERARALPRQRRCAP